MSKNREYPERPFVGVGVVVLRGNEVLLIQRGKAPNKGQWSIPGGKQRLGETIVQTVHRELLEETRVKIKQPALLDVVDVIMPDDKGEIQYHYTLVDYQAEWLSGECRSGDDADAVKWVSFDELNSVGLLKITREIILKAFSNYAMK
ncbi:MAG: NUDIX hydrolase [SAR324 cluster bacterium]|jgi:ADP-ribose pyrophosphatase YjhB (NUDIX family)|nr:NUDIX hydrolase [SAR324 cluster bacterium]MDP7169778.1 NUDIX hydrolase [SAR324 cluster bacterium]MDP7582982.1 NUDIX hydrolase [SAR324 cluster bacterium]HBR59635.1 phosphohydrolase [Deltaproteobacteria bacterium]HCV45072.1 phosphohydrolase [Deltaproteobacteria bacterium]|tara:strand:+ start:266 stop:706 length:441 start_codon:yes stop_codon:yes gene_type:complete